MLSTRVIGAKEILLIPLLLSCSPVCAEWTEWFVDVETSYVFQNNINHAMFSGEEENDQVWNGLVSTGRAYQLADKTRFFSNIAVGGHVHKEFEQLDQISTDINFSIHHKLGLGAFQPWVRGMVSTGYIFSSSQIREGQTVMAGLDVGKAFHERFDVVFSYRYDYRNNRGHSKSLTDKKLKAAKIKLGISEDVFDIQGHSVGIQLNTLLTQQWLLALSYNYRKGDIVSSNSPTLVPQVNTIIDAIAFDDALIGWAYRSKADTHSYSIDSNYVFLKGHAAVNVGFEYTESIVNSFTYQNKLARINFNYSF